MFKYATRLPPGNGLKLISDTVVRKNASFSRIEAIDFIERLANHLISNPNSTIVPIYRFKRLGRVGGSYQYHYDMMRMGILSVNEKQVIDDLCRNYYNYGSITLVLKKNPSYNKDYKELVSFMSKTFKDKRYIDLHSGNFMKDMDDNYRIIDIEGFYSYTHPLLTDPVYKWFTKGKKK